MQMLFDDNIFDRFSLLNIREFLAEASVFEIHVMKARLCVWLCMVEQ